MVFQPNILIAPSAYKGSLSASQVAAAIAEGLTKEIPDAHIQNIPLADGGDGTLEAIYTCLGGTISTATVTGPLGKETTASWLTLDDTIIIEMAKCCGLTTIQGEPLQPLDAHTYGLGQIISLCLLQPQRKLIIGLGGSASTDGGSAALSALGVEFRDINKKPLPYGGGYLAELESIDVSQLDKRVQDKQIELLTDVTSPLLGPNGAAAVYAPQKGANTNQIKILESGLCSLAKVIHNLTGNDLSNIPGSGAAGGTAFGLASLLKANILPGFKTISELIDLESAIAKADLVITAEGKLDNQSLKGKATGELAQICKTLDKPLWVFPALLEENISWTGFGIAGVYPTVGPNGKSENKYISEAARNAALRYIAVK